MGRRAGQRVLPYGLAIALAPCVARIHGGSRGLAMNPKGTISPAQRGSPAQEQSPAQRGHGAGLRSRKTDGRHGWMSLGPVGVAAAGLIALTLNLGTCARAQAQTAPSAVQPVAALSSHAEATPGMAASASTSSVADRETVHPATPAPAGLDADFRIGAGDVLHISVWREDTLTQTVLVRPDGKISLPLISEVMVAGRTPTETQELLKTKLSAFIEHPEVTVTVAEVNSRVVYILGEVQRPGAYPLSQSMDLLQLIARAGGLTPFAKKKSIYLLHQQGGPRGTFNYDKLIRGGKSVDSPVALISGDKVIVP